VTARKNRNDAGGVSVWVGRVPRHDEVTHAPWFNSWIPVFFGQAFFVMGILSEAIVL